MKRRWAIALAILWLGVACGVPTQRALQDQLHEFQRAYRWKNFAGIASITEPEDRKKLLEFYGGMDKTNIYSADLQMMEYDADALEAMTILNYTYSTLPSMTMKSGQLNLRWKYRDHSWWLEWPDSAEK